jgi:serine/threonine protein kinase
MKPANLLLNSECLMKIADFGLARTLGKDGMAQDGAAGREDRMTDYVATRWYRAPEILVGSDRYEEAVDLWSLGCIFAEMLGGRPVFSGSSTLNQIEKIVAVRRARPHATTTIAPSRHAPHTARCRAHPSTAADDALRVGSSCVTRWPCERTRPTDAGLTRMRAVVAWQTFGMPSDAEVAAMESKYAVTMFDSIVTDQQQQGPQGTPEQRMRSVYNADVASDAAIDLLCQLLRYRPSERITPSMGMQHPYCESFHEPPVMVWDGPPLFNANDWTRMFDDNTKTTTKQYRDGLYNMLGKRSAATGSRR